MKVNWQKVRICLQKSWWAHPFFKKGVRLITPVFFQFRMSPMDKYSLSVFFCFQSLRAQILAIQSMDGRVIAQISLIK